jgi:endo-1,4-beta-D-glucanase Y
MQSGMTNKITKLGIVLMCCAVIIFGLLWYRNRPGAAVPLVFSTRSMFETLWDNYKTNYIEKDTFRTINKQQDNITTSEGQSYTMFRAVEMDDQQTFDGALQWSKDNLWRKDDKLFSWLFGKDTDGKFRVLKDQGGYNSASDADVDIALALIFAYNRWHRDQYLGDAKSILKDIWDKEVVVINNIPYLTANNVEKFTSPRVIVNPSYFAPYAYRIFAKIDPATTENGNRNWAALVDSSYSVLNEVTSASLNTGTSAHLPPDWIVIDKKTGEMSATGIENLTTNFSFDALRVPWRIALDYAWNHEPRAKAYLDTLGFLRDEWVKKGQIAATYSHDGKVLNSAEVPAMYGASIGYFMISDPSDAEDVYNKKLKSLYNPDTNSWKKTLSYYDDNWAWFGIGLYNNYIKPL